jgi:hypothetical protein
MSHSSELAFRCLPQNGLTEPKETKSAYQNHFFLILCENLPVPAMVSDNAIAGRQNQCSYTTDENESYKIIRVPIARIATEVCASANTSEV